MSASRRSVTLTILVYVYIGLMIAGVVIAALGLGAEEPFELTFGTRFSLKADSIGLFVFFIGAALMSQLVARLNKDVQVFGARRANIADKLARAGSLPWVIVAALGLISLLFTLVAGR